MTTTATAWIVFGIPGWLGFLMTWRRAAWEIAWWMAILDQSWPAQLKQAKIDNDMTRLTHGYRVMGLILGLIAACAWLVIVPIYILVHTNVSHIFFRPPADVRRNMEARRLEEELDEKEVELSEIEKAIVKREADLEVLDKRLEKLGVR